MSRGSLSGDGSYSGSEHRRVPTLLNRPITEFLLLTIGVDRFVLAVISRPAIGHPPSQTQADCSLLCGPTRKAGVNATSPGTTNQPCALQHVDHSAMIFASPTGLTLRQGLDVPGMELMR